MVWRQGFSKPVDEYSDQHTLSGARAPFRRQQQSHVRPLSLSSRGHRPIGRATAANPLCAHDNVGWVLSSCRLDNVRRRRPGQINLLAGSQIVTYSTATYGQPIQVPAFEANVAIAVNTQGLTVNSAVAGTGAIQALNSTRARYSAHHGPDVRDLLGPGDRLE